MIRVLVAEDSTVTREYIVYLLSQDPAIDVVGVARNGLEALEQAEHLKPDLVLMDVYMPRMNGYQAAREIMERFPTPIVMMSASYNRDEVSITFEALKAGALTVVDKPPGPDHPAHSEGVRRLLETVKLMAEVKVVRRWPRRERGAPASPTPEPGPRKIRLVAIGASTGGPPVLAEILGGLPSNLSAPILVVQHIAPGFSAGLADWLSQGTRLGVKLAERGELIRSGTVYIAPDAHQLGIAGHSRIHLTKEPAEDGFCPSATHLFQSVAEAYGRSALGILLTGMGRDGAAGLLKLREAGGLTIAQDEETSVVFGMPGEAIRRGAAEFVLSPRRIGEAICSLVGKGN